LDFAIEGVVYDSETAEPLANSTVSLMPDCGGDKVEFETDASGRYRFILDRECCYSLKAGHEGYFAVSTDKPFCTKGLRKSQTFVHDFPLQRFVDPNGTTPPGPSGVAIGGETPCDGIGRSFVIKHIYYDFDKAYIRNDAEEPLSQLIKILADNPDLVVEIGSHTDARGSDRYNIRLSARRAESVVKYLINKEIDANRLQAKGYGETQPTNDCVDEIPCTEEQHQRNRRTEFRVIGKIDGTRYDCKTVDMDINQTSIEPIELKVDRCENCPF
jgi:outer membrane protein OmpA-like peptidoglycan-associated protein